MALPPLKLSVLDSKAILLGHVDGTKTAHLSGKDLCLLGSNSATDNGVVAVEVLGNFLERGVAGLDVELPDDEEFETEPDAVDDVVSPLDAAQSDGVDVLVEEESKVDAQEHQSHALGTDVVGQDFDRVTDQES